MSTKAENIVKLFGMTNQLLNEDLKSVEKEFAIELGHLPTANQTEDKYYPQFEHSVRKEASRMAAYYETFYCLEKSIRKLIQEQMDEDATDWWTTGKVPENVHTEVKKRIKKEIDAGITQRSTDKLDYTTFGELSVIITSNWDIFGGTIFNSRSAVEKVMANLNLLRNPIAHCSDISKDEATRLHLTVRDWFRLIGSNKTMEDNAE